MRACEYEKIGQLIKDLLRLPRPPAGKIKKLERHFETEYGLPSTHTMSGVLQQFQYFTMNSITIIISHINLNLVDETIFACIFAQTQH